MASWTGCGICFVLFFGQQDIVIGFCFLFGKSKKDRHCYAELPYSVSLSTCVAI